MKSQKNNEISKKTNSQKKKKKMKPKIFQNLKASELNQCQCKTMSVSDNVRI